MGNKVIKISIGMLTVIFIFIAALGVIYFKTDLLKPRGEIFQKYFKEGVEIVDNALDFANEQQYIKIFDEKDYNEETEALLKCKNSQDTEESFKISINGDTNNQTNQSYRDISIYDEENRDVIKLSVLKENDIYGVLFQDIIQQYISVDSKDSNAVFEIFDIDKNKITDFTTNYNLKKILNIIVDNKKNILDSVTDTVSKANKKQYKYLKEELIKLRDGQEVKAKKYQLNLSRNQIQSIAIDILEKIKNKEELDKIEENQMDFSIDN